MRHQQKNGVFGEPGSQVADSREILRYFTNSERALRYLLSQEKCLENSPNLTHSDNNLLLEGGAGSD